MRKKAKDSSKTIYFLTLSLRAGGAERQISELYKELPIEKIICLEKGNVYNVPNNKIITLSNHHEGVSSIIKYFFLPIYFYRLYKEIKPNKNVVLISFLERANLLNAICKFFFRNISIQSIRTNYTHYCIQKKIPFALKKVVIKSYKYADKVVGNSYGNTIDLVQNFGIDINKSTVINNFYDAEKIIRLSHEPLSNEIQLIFSAYKTITFVSRFDDKKGHLHLIRILNVLKINENKIKLFFIGDGEMKQKLIHLCHLLNLQVCDHHNKSKITSGADVYFMGFQKNPYQFIARSSIFAFPSIFEGMPNALVEAIICGTFCIAADCPSGPREIMTNTTSLSKVLTEPELTKYGYLMPTFSGDLIFTDSPLTIVEELWKNTIIQVLQNENIIIDNSDLIQRFAKETIINKWKIILEKTGEK